MKIPFMKLNDTFMDSIDEITESINDIIRTNRFINGSEVAEFETEFSSFCEDQKVVAVGNGTDAIILTLKALGIGIGDSVITVPNTFTATTEAIIAVGAEIIFTEISEDDFLMDPNKLSETINMFKDSKRIKAVIPVHLYGQMCKMDQISTIARKNNIYIIEDSAQAHMAKYKGHSPGFYGDVATYSFYPGKNLGAFGDAGAITTFNVDLAKKIKMLSNHGRTDKYMHELIGYNSRMDTIQAAVLKIKLKALSQQTKQRIAKANLYIKYLTDLSQIIIPKTNDLCLHVYHLFVIRLPFRHELIEVFKEKGISYGIHYPTPLHLQPAYDKYRSNNFELSENMSQEIISLPLWNGIKDEQIQYICNVIRTVYDHVLGEKGNSYEK